MYRRKPSTQTVTLIEKELRLGNSVSKDSRLKDNINFSVPQVLELRIQGGFLDGQDIRTLRQENLLLSKGLEFLLETKFSLVVDSDVWPN